MEPPANPGRFNEGDDAAIGAAIWGVARMDLFELIPLAPSLGGFPALPLSESGGTNLLVGVLRYPSEPLPDQLPVVSHHVFEPMASLLEGLQDVEGQRLGLARVGDAVTSLPAPRSPAAKKALHPSVQTVSVGSSEHGRFSFLGSGVSCMGSRSLVRRALFGVGSTGGAGIPTS